MEIRKHVVALVILAVPGLASAGDLVPEPDHLKCYKIKHLDSDLLPNRTVQLNNQFREEACEIKGRPNRFCVETVKNQGDDPFGGLAGHFLCYDIITDGTTPRCSEVRIAPQEAIASDQFRDWKIQVRLAQAVCTPVEKIHPIPANGSP